MARNLKVLESLGLRGQVQVLEELRGRELVPEQVRESLQELGPG